MATIVKGDLYEKLDGQLHELKRQIRQPKGYPHDPEILKLALQVVIENPNRVFMSGGTVITIDRSKPFNPAKFIGKGWTIEEQDERSLVLTTVDLSAVRLETTLRDGENCVKGEEKLRRLKATKCIRLDAKVFLTLWENKSFIPESWKGKYVYFDGTILRNPLGFRYVLFLCWHDGEWRWNCGWLENGRFVQNPSAVLAE